MMIGRSTGVLAGIAIGLVLGASGGCVERVIRWCPPGTEGCPCDAGSCQGELTCRSDECIPAQTASCEQFLDELSCGGVDFGQVIDCSAFDPSCDLSDFLDCLSANFSCIDDIPNVNGWRECSPPPGCDAVSNDSGFDPSETSGDFPDTDSASVGSASVSVGTDSVSESTDSVDPDPGPCATDPDDDDCDGCVKSACCDEWAACVANPVCDCLVGCVRELGLEGLPECQARCNSEGSLPPEAIPLQGCQAQNCSSPCQD